MGRDWIILRTSSRNTLRLAAQLIKDGFDAWTPARTFRKRVPRKNEVYEITAPLLPSFAFARANHIHTLLALAEEPVKPHPDFSVFHYLNEIPMIADGELHPLRMIEDRDQRRLEAERLSCRRRQVMFKPGSNIRIAVGAFAGMLGTVEKDDGKFALVNFGLGKPVKISTFILTGENILCSPQPTAEAA